MTQTSPSAKQLSIIKEWLKGSIILDLEDSLEKARLYGSDEILESKIYTPHYMIQAIDKVTTDDIKNVAKDLFVPRNLNLALIGPHQKNEFDDIIPFREKTPR